jgi:uncharacterized membrane protein (DUF4010 family)
MITFGFGIVGLLCGAFGFVSCASGSERDSIVGAGFLAAGAVFFVGAQINSQLARIIKNQEKNTK